MDTPEGAELVVERQRIELAVVILCDYMGIDGKHHKQYAMDQAIRVLTGDKYQSVKAYFMAGKDDGWDEGVPA